MLTSAFERKVVMISNRRCIFHIPNKVDDVGSSGSQIRPLKMLAAFRNLGYAVDVVMGYGEERKKAIEQIKVKILNGVKYEFVYSESSTMPTLLTEKHHYPTYPNLDFGFLCFCKKQGLKIGLFYRDIYWKFPTYRHVVHGFKLCVALLAYRYDFYKYEQLLDVFYLPTELVLKYVARPKLSSIYEPLPPGAVFDGGIVEQRKRYFDNYQEKQGINIFYVGGVRKMYDFSKLLNAVQDLPFVTMTICCREEEWEGEGQKNRYMKFMNDHITVVHKFGKELEEYYSQATLCALVFDEDEYRKMAMPIKLFEYLSHVTPIISSKGTAAADFVEKNDIGWCVDYDVDAIKGFLTDLYEHKEKIIEKHNYMLRVLPMNTWEKRAEKVAEDLRR